MFDFGGYRETALFFRYHSLQHNKASLKYRLKLILNVSLANSSISQDK